MKKSLWKSIWGWVVFCLIIAFVGNIAQQNADWLGLLLPVGRRLGLFLRSLVLCGGVALVDLFLGILIANALWNWPSKLRWVRWLPLILGVLPPYLQAMAWSDIFQIFPTQIWGELAAGWVMIMAYLPIGVGFAILSLETVSSEQVDAARIWHSDLAVLLRVMLPLSAPLLMAGAAFIFLLNLMDYSVPSLFGVNIYALEIFAEYSATSQPGRVLLLSVPLIVVAAALLPIMSTAVRFAGQHQTWKASPWSRPPVWPGGFVFLQRAALGFWVIQVGTPIVSLVWQAFSGSGNNGLFTPAVADLGLSFGVAAATAILSLPFAWLGMEAVRGGSGLAWLMILPLTIPAPLVGTGMVALFNQPAFEGVYNSVWMLIFVGVVRFMPFGVLALLAQLCRVDPLSLDAARVFQRGVFHGIWQVNLPLLAPGLISAGCLVFALALGELGATLIVIPPGYSTLSLRIYNYLHYGANEVVAQLSLVVLGLTLAAGSTAALVLARMGQPKQLASTEDVQ